MVQSITVNESEARTIFLALIARVNELDAFIDRFNVSRENMLYTHEQRDEAVRLRAYVLELYDSFSQ